MHILRLQRRGETEHDRIAARTALEVHQLTDDVLLILAGQFRILRIGRIAVHAVAGAAGRRLALSGGRVPKLGRHFFQRRELLGSADSGSGGLRRGGGRYRGDGQRGGTGSGRLGRHPVDRGFADDVRFMRWLRGGHAGHGEHGGRGKPLPDTHTIFSRSRRMPAILRGCKPRDYRRARKSGQTRAFPMSESPNPLRGAAFVLAAHTLDQLPADAGAEIAFAGRSNAGKSSALNALAGHGHLARTSKTPGRTQQLVVFNLPDGRRLIDLPGYGYAKVPMAMREHWRETIDAYLRTRQSLRGLVLISDIRQALKEFDQQMLAFCAAIELPCVVLLSKADKLSRAQAQTTQRAVEREIANTGWPGSTILFSATAGTGIAEARGAAIELLGG